MLGKRATLGAVTTIACAAALASCGGSDDPEPSIPEQAGDEIVAALDEVDARVEAGDCEDAETKAQAVRDAIDALPADVPDDLHQALVQGSDNLIQQIPEQCEPADEDKDPVEPPPVDSGATGAEGAVP